MTYSLQFESQHTYDDAGTGIGVPVELSFGDRAVILTAKLDTGASFCIFARTYAEALGLDVEKGQLEWVSTAVGGRFLTFGHEVTISTIDIEFDAMVYFAKEEVFKRNVLGRRGWLDQLRIGLIDYDRSLYLSGYNMA